MKYTRVSRVKIVYYSLAKQITILSWDAAQGYFHSSLKVLLITTDNSKSQIKTGTDLVTKPNQTVICTDEQ